MYKQDTVAALATAPGLGGIAIVRISGPESYQVASRVFRPKNPEKNVEKMPGYSALFGDFLQGASVLDSGILLCFRAPHSYTGEDVVELSCHGGSAVSAAVLSACYKAGAAPAGPGEFTKRAVLNGRMDLTQAEAVLDLIHATTGQGVQLAGAALRGRTFKAIDEVKQGLVQLAGHLAAYTDYPEEDVEELGTEAFLTALDTAEHKLGELMRGYETGSLVRRGVLCAIVGSPNVGKSTLFNLLSGFERAIVTPVAGTTRDVVREQISIGGIPLQLMDTAGLHETQDIVEAEGIRRSYDALEQAGLVIAVFDGSQPLGDLDYALAKRCAGKPALGIVNKSDLGVEIELEALQPCFRRLLHITAQNPASLQEIEQVVLEILQLDSFDPNAAALATERQLYAANAALEAIGEAKQALRAGFTLDAAGACLDDALLRLSELTGESASDTVINDVFSRFCVGK